MFFLFGWGTQTKKFEGPTEMRVCRVCGKESDWHLHRHSKWMTAFLVPVLPYSMKWVHSCPECGNFEVPEDEEKSRLIKMARLKRAFKKGKVKRGEYEMEIAKLRRGGNWKSGRDL